MGMTLEKVILAVVTIDRHQVAGGAPIFYASSEDELQQLAFTLEKIMDAMAHTLNERTMILVKHF
jgi:hypothetical protein